MRLMVGTLVPLDTADLVGECILAGLTTGRERTLLSARLDLALWWTLLGLEVMTPGWAGTVSIPEPREDAPSLGRERCCPLMTVYSNESTIHRLILRHFDYMVLLVGHGMTVFDINTNSEIQNQTIRKSPNLPDKSGEIASVW